MNRGSHSEHVTPRPNAGAFNEAPIHESGKLCGQCHLAATEIRLQ